jgi:nucleotide-binding universal stress UspA family protein
MRKVAWDADVVVIGHTTRRGTGEPFLGDAAQRVLEFSSRPVLVMPARGNRVAGTAGAR